MYFWYLPIDSRFRMNYFSSQNKTELKGLASNWMWTCSTYSAVLHIPRLFQLACMLEGQLLHLAISGMISKHWKRQNYTKTEYRLGSALLSVSEKSVVKFQTFLRGNGTSIESYCHIQSFLICWEAFFISAADNNRNPYWSWWVWIVFRKHMKCKPTVLTLKFSWGIKIRFL